MVNTLAKGSDKLVIDSQSPCFDTKVTNSSCVNNKSKSLSESIKLEIHTLSEPTVGVKVTVTVCGTSTIVIEGTAEGSTSLPPVGTNKGSGALVGLKVTTLSNVAFVHE